MPSLSNIQQLVASLWSPNVQRLVWWKRWPITAGRLIYLLIHDLSSGQLNLRAMSLVFTTMLSFVPLIAVSFSVLKAFDVHHEIEPLLINALAPLGPEGREVAENVIGFVDNIKVGLLGAVGIGFLFFSVLSLVQKVEEAFNYTWRIERTRSLMERFSTYLSVIMVGPVLVFSAIGLTASLRSHSMVQTLSSVEPFGTLITAFSFLLPYLLIIAAFTFLYLFVPNTKVRLIPAITGGLVAGVLWQTVGWIYALVVSMSSAKTAIYASFAILFFFMTWLYLNWLILLVGSSVAFYRQYPEYLFTRTRDIRLSNYDREALALTMMLDIGRAYYQKQMPPSVSELSDKYIYPKQPICEVLQSYEQAGILRKLAETSDDTYIIAMPAESLSLAEMLKVLRHDYKNTMKRGLMLPATSPVIQALQGVENAFERSLDDMNLRDFIAESEAAESSSEESVSTRMETKLRKL